MPQGPVHACKLFLYHPGITGRHCLGHPHGVIIFPAAAGKGRRVLRLQEKRNSGSNLKAGEYIPEQQIMGRIQQIIKSIG